MASPGWTRTVEQWRAWSPLRRTITVIAVLAMVVVAVVTARPRERVPEGYDLARMACDHGRDILSDYVDGVRSRGEILGRLASAEDTAADAAAKNPKYRPVAQAVVQTRTNLVERDSPGTAIYEACDPVDAEKDALK